MVKVKLSKAVSFLKKRQEHIVLLIGVILISLLSFAAGYIVAKQQEKTPIKIEYNYKQLLPKGS